jgi:hypothetical protein
MYLNSWLIAKKLAKFTNNIKIKNALNRSLLIKLINLLTTQKGSNKSKIYKETINYCNNKD